MAAGTIQKNIVLLWTNPNPTSAWPSSNKIALDLSPYDAVIVIVAASKDYATATGQHLTQLLPINHGAWYSSYIIVNGVVTHWIRHVTPAEDGISFWSGATISGNGVYNGGLDQYGIPLKVYGVKF